MLAQRGRVQPIALGFDFIRFAVIVRAGPNGWRSSDISMKSAVRSPAFRRKRRMRIHSLTPNASA
jgi:hypothetical protein